jgi:hypothetical protein
VIRKVLNEILLDCQPKGTKRTSRKMSPEASYVVVNQAWMVLEERPERLALQPMSQMERRIYTKHPSEVQPSTMFVLLPVVIMCTGGNNISTETVES